VLGSSELVAFVATTDLDRARAFYGGVLGLPVVEESPFACVFDAHGTQLRVTPVTEIRPAPYTVLGWAVDDIAATVRALGAAGVSFERFPGMEQDALGVWAAPSGARVAWFADPDGNVLSLTQADAPGDTA
jgi:catechol 2,3-dioxygenase-like lactoylglutathione lyase family enzyme